MNTADNGDLSLKQLRDVPHFLTASIKDSVTGNPYTTHSIATTNKTLEHQQDVRDTLKHVYQCINFTWSDLIIFFCLKTGKGSGTMYTLSLAVLF